MILQGAWKLYISLLVHSIYIFVGLAFLLLAIAMFDIRLFSEIITRRTEDAQKRQYRRERIKNYCIAFWLSIVGVLFIIAGVTSTIDNVQDIREGSIQGVVRAGNLKKPTSRYGRAYVITYRGHYWKEISSNRTVALDNTREVEVWYRPSFFDTNANNVADPRTLYVITVCPHSGQLVSITAIKVPVDNSKSNNSFSKSLLENKELLDNLLQKQ